MVPYGQAYGAGFEDMRRRVPDLSKIRELVGYRPQLGLDQILQRVIDHERRSAATHT
jgi:UDP-glucose 4-epimerase